MTLIDFGRITNKLKLNLSAKTAASHGPPTWWILDETIWSHTSLRVNRISGSKNFRSTPQHYLPQPDSEPRRADTRSNPCSVAKRRTRHFKAGASTGCRLTRAMHEFR